MYEGWALNLDSFGGGTDLVDVTDVTIGTVMHVNYWIHCKCQY
jgi:hypothetical protein